MAKPFSIQAPENIAKEYAGNKQKIAQAAQMGIVDPTAAVLAGMFIDRMRSAQVMEAAQQPTVAQQVLGGQPPQGALPAPQQGMGPPPQGMGAPPQMPVAPPPQDMGMGAPPQGMAMGGLTTLPIPDAMFDEPDNGSYAGGGMVAFAPGGDVDAERLRRALLMQESGGDYGITNAEGSGAMGAYQFMPETARALAKRLGKEYRPDLMTGDKGRSKEGRAYQESLMDAQMKDILAYSDGDIGKAGAYHFAGPNTKGHGPKTRKYEQDILRRYSGSKEGLGKIPERNMEAPEGRRASFLDQLSTAEELFAGLPNSGLGEASNYYKKEISEESIKKNRKDDMWMAIAQLGANMAASDSPSFLQSVGQAIARTMPGVEANKKERKAAERSAMNALTDIYGMQRKEAKEVFEFGVRLAEADMNAENAETDREFRSAERIANDASRMREIEAQKGVEERMVEAYYKDFKKQGMDDNRAYQAAVIAAKTAIERTEPPKAGGKTTNAQATYNAAMEAQGSAGFKYLGTDG